MRLAIHRRPHQISAHSQSVRCRMARKNLLIVSNPSTPELVALNNGLDTSQYNVVATGRTVDEFKVSLHAVSFSLLGLLLTLLSQQDMSDDVWRSIEIMLICGVGVNAAKKADIELMWPRLTSLKWIHSSSAGLEHLLFPALVDSDVTLTNAKGVYSHSLAEFALLGMKWFAMDVPKLLQQKRASKWAPYDVEELRGKTLGVIGLGDIGMASAKLAKSYQMSVIGCRRRVERSTAESEIVDSILPPSSIVELCSQCDYVLMATPHTPETHKLMSAEAIKAMKTSAVFLNVGRGKCVDEPALITALSEGKIKGAALDVFYEEPLPESSPLWTLDNVFMSPHCADRTKEFQFQSMQLFLRNTKAWAAAGATGEEQKKSLANVCDKKLGY
jgi:phosphoglycerate dehydrogenase-like enzyme